jgi:type I restriction enzyme S subunit
VQVLSVYTENFETIFGVKNNIQALRNKVLELAIQGKLVEQDPNDEPASELVRKIHIVRNKLVEEGKIKKQNLETVSQEEIPFEVPSSWEWVRLGDVSAKITDGEHITPRKTESGVPLLSAKNLYGGRLSFTNIDYISAEDATKFWNRCKPEINDILVGGRGSIGNTVINDCSENFCLMGSVILIKPLLLDCRYIYYLLKSGYGQMEMKGRSFQTAISALYLKDIVKVVVPLPTLNEQHRIVTKIEFLMSEIDKLEESLQKKEHLMELLPKAVVDAIGKCQTVDELREQLKFVIENYETIFETPESMQELRNVILQLAIEGKLVPQDPSDESASELLNKIKIEKDKLVKEGSIKKQQPLEPIEEEEIPFEIPESWEWVRLGDIGDSLIGLTYSPTNVVSDGLPVLRSNNIKNARMNYDELVYVDVKVKDELIVRKEDILVCARNGSARLVGKSALIDDESDGEMTFGAFMTLFRSKINKYVYLMLNTNFFRSQLGESNTMTVNQITQSMLRNILIPIPPNEEQHRIVKKVESVMNLIDQLENKLNRKVDLVEKMANM